MNLRKPTRSPDQVGNEPDPMSDSREISLENLPSFEDLLWEWIAVQERSIRLWKGKDALWWYGERSSLGGFAGAVWRSGGLVLEEYSTEKTPFTSHETRKAKKVFGRGDMDFAMAGWKFTIEAKHCWPLYGVEIRLNLLEQAWLRFVRQRPTGTLASRNRTDLSIKYRIGVVKSAAFIPN